jgi:NAD(P)-dependent dehydrogenase (short-subunit alcohol dehydrogenase family)
MDGCGWPDQAAARWSTEVEMTDLAGKAALVTGAQQGIGKATAIALARAGADVVINCLDPAAADEVAAAVRATGRRAILAEGDVAASDTPARLVAATVAAFGRIDILVNNAGVFPRVAFLEMTEQDWDHVHSINLKASCFCAQAAARSMVAAGGGGAIISLASSAIFGASARGVHYSASKGGVVSLTRAMALELAPWKIRVNAIAPGLTDTAQPRYGSTEEELAARAAAMPLGRMGQPEDIANVAVFLASEKAAFMTGQTVHANGGIFMAS